MRHLLHRGKFLRSGQGAVVFLLLIVLAVLSVFAFFQNFLSSVNAQRENVSTGKRAFYLAESAINEAFLDFTSKVNVPSTDPNSWFQLARKPLSGGYRGYEEKLYEPELTELIYDDSGITIKHVRVSLWEQKAIQNLDYEKTALLSFTAIVSIPRRSRRLFGTHIRRNVQKSFEVKHVLITPPRPFDRFSLFLLHWSYLQKAKDAYDDLQRQFKDQEEAYEKSLNDSMNQLQSIVIDMVQKAKEGLDEINDAIANPPFPMSSGDVRDEIEEKLAEQDLSIDKVTIIANTDPSAWMSPAGYPADLAAVQWPPFRNDGSSLAMPVYSKAKKVTSQELPIQLPQTPRAPSPSPNQQIPQNPTTWDWPTLTCLSSPYSSWISDYGSPLPPYSLGVQTELERHEGIFLLVPDSWKETFKNEYIPKVYPAFWREKAAYHFANDKELKKHLVLGDTAYLDGVYVIDGSVSIDWTRYKGSGAIIAKGNVDVGSPRNAGDGTLTITSLKSIYVDGNPQAALMAPLETINFNGATIDGMAYMAYLSGDDFCIKLDDNLASKDSAGKVKLDKYWVTVSPYHITCNFLRK